MNVNFANGLSIFNYKQSSVCVKMCLQTCTVLLTQSLCGKRITTKG